MNENDKICRILIVDNNVEYAQKVAYELSELHPKLLDNQPLEIEISNTAYFVARHLDNISDDKAPWDIILSDVYMPIPSTPLDRNTADEEAELKETSYKDNRWKFWEYKYSWNSHAEGTPEHGGLYIAQKVKELKKRKQIFKDLKVVLISDKLIDPIARKKVFDFSQSEKSWFNYYDKTNWEEGTGDWPDHLNRPNIFRRAVIHAINERKSEIWGDSMKGEHGVFLILSKAMQEIDIDCKTLVKDKNVDIILIAGERGTGKSQLAQKIHNMKVSGANAKFVTVECTTVSNELFAGAIFGHIKGAFTGADYDNPGFVETAKSGTLFFDEIGDLSSENQGKLLRLIQDKKFVKVGTNEDKNSEVNLIIFATNKNLDDLVKNDFFRPDLYDRINQYLIKIPSLKERKEEIIPLAEHFIKELESDLSLTDDAKQFLQEQNWEGNVRELKKVILNATTYCTSRELKVIDIKPYIQKETHQSKADPKPVADNHQPIEITAENIVEGKIKWSRIKKVLSYEQRSAIMIAVRSLWQGQQRELAELLDVNPNSLEQFFATLKRKIRSDKLDIQNLKFHLIPNHYPALETFFDETLKSKR